jgi:hypothetical protein
MFPGSCISGWTASADTAPFVFTPVEHGQGFS